MEPTIEEVEGRYVATNGNVRGYGDTEDEALQNLNHALGKIKLGEYKATIYPLTDAERKLFLDNGREVDENSVYVRIPGVLGLVYTPFKHVFLHRED